MSNLSPSFVVTLVHGTFANESASWMQEQSELRKVIEDECNEQVVVRIFPWSGKNSHPKRLEAADSLIKSLKDTFQEFPNQRHFVIAHSHGGNIALYAAKDETVRSHLAGALFIATPFIHCKKRHVIQTTKFLINGVTVIAALPFMLAFWQVGGLEWLLHITANYGTILNQLFRVTELLPKEIRLLIFAPLGILFYPIYLARTYTGLKLAKWGRDSQINTIRKIATFNADKLPLPVHCAIAENDEARIGLKILRGICAIPHYFWRPILQEIIVAVAFIYTGIDTFIKFRGVEDIVSKKEAFFLYAAQSLLQVGLYLSVLYACIFIVMVFLPIFVRSHWIGFGRESIIDNLFTDVFVESLPPSSKNGTPISQGGEVTPFENISSTLYEIRGRGLNHSLIYSDANFLKDFGLLVKRAMIRPEEEKTVTD